MRALVFDAPYDVRAAELAAPAIEAPGDAIVRVELAGLCGSDLHPYRGHETGLDAGTIMGHELVGVVEEVGPAVGTLAPGRRVVAPFSTACGSCYFCVSGLSARCERGELLGWRQDGRGLHGAQAEYVRVPLADATLVDVPPGLDIAAALLAGDNLATACYAAEQAQVAPGAVVAVVGCGPVGLCAVFGALAHGASRVFAVDAVAERLQLAESFGAEPLELDAGPLEAVRRATSGRGADAVLECVGSPEATRLAVDLARPGGTVAAVGVHTEEQFAFAPGEAYDKNLVYAAGRCPARRYLERLLSGLGQRRWDPTPIISHRLPLGAAADAYRMFAERRDGCTKVVFQLGL